MTAPKTAALALADIADEIEQSDGIALMLTGCTRQLGIKKTAQVVAALRVAAARDDAVREVLGVARSCIENLGAGKGGWAWEEVLSMIDDALQGAKPDTRCISAEDREALDAVYIRHLKARNDALTMALVEIAAAIPENQGGTQGSIRKRALAALQGTKP